MTGVTFKRYCEFRIQLIILDGTIVRTQIIANGQQPFRVTGYPKPPYIEGDGTPYSEYRKAYVGGIANSKARGKFAEVDPRSYWGQQS